MFIPNSAVGAIIGTKGSNIRSMIRFSGASVKVASTENEKQGAAGDANSAQQATRKVTIVGTADSQWKVNTNNFYQNLMTHYFFSTLNNDTFQTKIVFH